MQRYYGIGLQRYTKGARSERELLNRFYELGYSVIRAAGSGVNALGPDIIAMKKGICFSIECKAWSRGSLSIEPDQFLKLMDWEKNTDGHTFVAWKVDYKGWYFIRLDEFSKGESNYNVTLKRALEINRNLESVISMASPQNEIDATQPQVSSSQLQ